MGAAAPKIEITIGGKKIDPSALISYTIDRDMDQPDMAVVTVSNQTDSQGGEHKIGGALEVKVGIGSDAPKSIFKGEMLGADGSYKGGGTTTLTVRSVSKLHKLLRKKHSETYQNMDDQAILNKVAGRHGLSLEFKGPKIQYKHVYQHNQSDLEFLRMRAARIGCHVWCVDSKLMVKEPEFGDVVGEKLSVDRGGILRSFNPRISSSSITKKVTVKGWDPEKKVEIVGKFEAKSSPLGSTPAHSACGEWASPETFFVDQPVHSKEEADAFAKARLMEMNLQYITGEAEVRGGPEFDLGKVVEIEANANGKDPYNGKYYIMGVTHRHTLPKKSDGGYVTILKLARDAEGG